MVTFAATLNSRDSSSCATQRLSELSAGPTSSSRISASERETALIIVPALTACWKGPYRVPVLKIVVHRHGFARAGRLCCAEFLTGPRQLPTTGWGAWKATQRAAWNCGSAGASPSQNNAATSPGRARLLPSRQPLGRARLLPSRQPLGRARLLPSRGIKQPDNRSAQQELRRPEGSIFALIPKNTTHSSACRI